MTSFFLLQKLPGGRQPDGIFVRTPDLDEDPLWLDQMLHWHFPDALRIWYHPAGSPPLFQAGVAGRLLLDLVVPLELCSTIHRALGRRPAGGSEILRYLDIRLDWGRHRLQVLPEEEFHDIPVKEARILRAFLQNPGRCMSRDEIREKVWEETTVSCRTIDSHVSRLRKRLGQAGVGIESIYGGGYMLR